jgi:hypothetical protein
MCVDVCLPGVMSIIYIDQIRTSFCPFGNSQAHQPWCLRQD